MSYFPRLGSALRSQKSFAFFYMPFTSHFPSPQLLSACPPPQEASILRHSTPKVFSVLPVSHSPLPPDDLLLDCPFFFLLPHFNWSLRDPHMSFFLPLLPRPLFRRNRPFFAPFRFPGCRITHLLVFGPARSRSPSVRSWNRMRFFFFSGSEPNLSSSFELSSFFYNDTKRSPPYSVFFSLPFHYFFFHQFSLFFSLDSRPTARSSLLTSEKKYPRPELI